MSERLQLPIALWRLQYHLLGGNRRMGGIASVYAVALVVGAYGCRRIFYDVAVDEIAGYMLNALAGIQLFLVVLAGCNAVHRASLRDYESKMIESHRLTPMTNVTVVLGYLFGTTLQIQLFFLVGLAVGTVLTALAQFPIKDWIAGNLFILNGAVTMWSAVLLSGLRLAKPTSPAGFIMVAAALGNAGIVLLPAAGLLLCAYPMLFGFQIITGGISLGLPVLLMIAAVNVVMTLFWLSAAAAKYRRPDLPALNAVRGLILLAFWVVLGTVGSVIYFSKQVAGTGMAPTDNDTLMIQWIATMVLSFLVALPAIAGSVECRSLIRRGTAARSWADRVPPILVCILATLVVMLPMALLGSSLWNKILHIATDDPDRLRIVATAWFYSFAACFLAFVTAGGAHSLFFVRVKKPRIAASAFLILVWAIPPIADMIRAQWVASKDVYSALEISWLVGCSPAGTIALVWQDPLRYSLLPGLAFQAVLALCLLLIPSFKKQNS